jgi:hypothetical protein
MEQLHCDKEKLLEELEYEQEQELEALNQIEFAHSQVAKSFND